jgi:hypothetical protein
MFAVYIVYIEAVWHEPLFEFCVVVFEETIRARIILALGAVTAHLLSEPLPTILPTHPSCVMMPKKPPCLMEEIRSYRAIPVDFWGLL